jgi:16S rRNA (guanine966-N2)-methyltransferase
MFKTSRVLVKPLLSLASQPPLSGALTTGAAGVGLEFFVPKMLNNGKACQNLTESVIATIKMPLHFKPSTAGRPKSSNVANRVRIIGGNWRSRIIGFTDADGLRPTASRVRETLFNWLGQSLHGKRCLDLFSGSGALGFEAASRGAIEVVMLETQPAALLALKENQRKLDAAMCRIAATDALKYLRTAIQKFDVVFVDPPFASDLMAPVLIELADSLAEEAMVYTEWHLPITDVLANLSDDSWEVVKKGRAGAVHFALIRRAASHHQTRSEN